MTETPYGPPRGGRDVRRPVSINLPKVQAEWVQKEAAKYNVPMVRVVTTLIARAMKEQEGK